jgi:hypothetical protein
MVWIITSTTRAIAIRRIITVTASPTIIIASTATVTIIIGISISIVVGIVISPTVTTVPVVIRIVSPVSKIYIDGRACIIIGVTPSRIGIETEKRKGQTKSNVPVGAGLITIIIVVLVMIIVIISYTIIISCMGGRQFLV